VKTVDQPRGGWTTVLRRQPVRIVEGEPEGGYTSAFEVICCDCGDDPVSITATSHPSCSGSVGRTRSRPASRHMRSTSRSTTSTNQPYEPGRPGAVPPRAAVRAAYHGA
jgi:hypothetical protein